MSPLGRLAAVSALGAAAVAAWPAQGTGRAQQRSEHVHYRSFRVDGPDGASQRALAVFPRRVDRQDHPEDARYPLVVALHGRGEARKGPKRGPLGWSVDYELPQAFGALARGELTTDAYGGLVTEAHLRAVNAELAAAAFGGCMVVTPYLPDLQGREQLHRYADWLAGAFIEQVRARFTAARTRRGTGIDGVSLGGWVALEAGLRHPGVFGAVGGIQPAIAGRVEHLASLAAAARQADRPVPSIRLLTSSEDPYRAPTRALSRQLRQARVAHRLLELPGPHDYPFNRGPGALELLRFHTRALVREPL